MDKTRLTNAMRRFYGKTNDLLMAERAVRMANEGMSIARADLFKAEEELRQASGRVCRKCGESIPQDYPTGVTHGACDGEIVNAFWLNKERSLRGEWE